MGTNCAPLISDLFLFCYKRDSTASLIYHKEAEIIQAFNSIFRYLDDLLNIDNPYFKGIVGQIYTSELHLNKANASDTEIQFLDLHYLFQTDLLHPKFMISAMTLILTNFPCLDEDVLLSTSYGVYIYQIIRFARVSNHVTDFN